MRIARLRTERNDAYYHVVNYVAGLPGQQPFTEELRAEYIERLKQCADFFTVEPIAFAFMPDHYHLILHDPGDELDDEEACERYNEYYKDRKVLFAGTPREIKPGTPACKRAKKRMTDMAMFMRDFQQQIAHAFKSKSAWRGNLWAERYKSTILEAGTALWEAVKHVECNGARLTGCEMPGDYAFCSWYAFSKTGKHPFQKNFVRHLKSNWPHKGKLPKKAFLEIARLDLDETWQNRKELLEAAEASTKRKRRWLRLDQHDRVWANGFVIGSEDFVRETAAEAYPDDKAQSHQLMSMRTLKNEKLYSYRRLNKRKKIL